jgi:hypothetical protein
MIGCDNGADCPYQWVSPIPFYLSRSGLRV